MQLDLLYGLAIDLGRSMVLEDRFARLVDVLRQALPCDSAALLLVEGDRLRPLATHGLRDEVYGRSFALPEHPRLAAIAAAPGPHLFPAACDLPDPFDGLIAAPSAHLTSVHSCLGIPLRLEDELVGILAADALEGGAFESVPMDALGFLGALAAAALHTGLRIEAAEHRAQASQSLVRELRRSEGGANMLGTSPALQRIRAEIGIVAESTLSVLITGETGVGKEHVALGVHRTSARRNGPLVHVNCAALPDALAESELFGHERGAFTGADEARKGRFEAADGGTLFLDEVGELSAAVQSKLLRALQLGEIQRVGSDESRRFDVRVVAATNRDPVSEIDAGRFRSDLYHRLCQFPIHVPPLRSRREDIPVLAALFAERSQVELGTGPVRFTDDAHGVLAAHPWPGNVRELQNVIARTVLRASRRGASAVLLDEGALLMELEAAPRPGAARLADPPVPGTSEEAEELPLPERVERFKRAEISRELARTGGNLAAAARALGVERSNLHATVKRLGIPRPGR